MVSSMKNHGWKFVKNPTPPARPQMLVLCFFWGCVVVREFFGWFGKNGGWLHLGLRGWRSSQHSSHHRIITCHYLFSLGDPYQPLIFHEKHTWARRYTQQKQGIFLRYETYHFFASDQKKTTTKSFFGHGNPVQLIHLSHEKKTDRILSMKY